MDYILVGVLTPAAAGASFGLRGTSRKKGIRDVAFLKQGPVA